MKTISNVYLVSLAVFLYLTTTVLASTITSYSNYNNKPRITRGFKSAALSTARGFGKRNSGVGVAAGAGGGGITYPDGTLGVLFDSSGEKEYLGLSAANEKSTESLPAEWFIEELANNPELARIVVHRFIDLNQDGQLSADELLRQNF